ncbi:ATP-dependent Clp protease ATP-binding subunit [Parabacteroides distasonis]|nr:ATP-dependent Clp protease ATP-binding subunit [Parabacteroides distasonis]
MIQRIENIARALAEERCSDAIYPAHLMKAILHKEAGLVSFIETQLDKDYYYLQDWADVQMELSPRATRPKRDLDLSAESEAVLEEADNYKLKYGLEETNAVCVLAALVTPGVGFTFDQLKTLPLTAAEISERMGAGAEAAQPSFEPTPGAVSKSDASLFEKYGLDLVKQVREGKIGVIVGFDEELQTVFETLGRKTKSNLLITGEAGVGKTALIQAFATRLANDEVPEFLKGASAYELDLVSLAADAQYKGEVEDRFKQIVRAMGEQRGSGAAVLVIESVDKLFDKQGALYGCSSILKQELTRGSLQLLCTSSIDGYTKYIETDKEVVGKLEKLTVEEPTADLCLAILKGALPAYEQYHGLTVGEEEMTSAIRLAKRYLNEKALPDSAFDLIDRAMAALKIHNDRSEEAPRLALLTADLEGVVAKQTGIPLGKVQTSERDRLLGAEETLKQRVIGQDHAIKKVLDSVFESRSGLNKKGQPMGSFFFLGPTGTGKTELSKSLAAFLFGDESALLRFDMSEFKEEHSVALLYGAPPGYVGYEEGGLLVNKIRQNPYSVVLFDEIEKAHKSVFDLFLQILDEGKLHDRLGRVGDFSNALILFTSNIGSQFISKQFQAGEIPTNTQMMEIMQQYFRPEFLARLTEIVPFSPITEQTVVKIFDIHLKGLLKLLAEQEIRLEMSDEVKANIAMRGFDPQYGARQIIGNIRKELRHPLSKLIISGKVKGGDTVVVSLADGEVCFDVKPA